jgi:hypothetical protein
MEVPDPQTQVRFAGIRAGATGARQRLGCGIVLGCQRTLTPAR